MSAEQENNFSQFLAKKSYEIAYALFRLATTVKRPSFADNLEGKGLALLAATIAEDYAGTRIVSRGTEYLLQFGADVGVINQANTQTITGELKAFDSAIAELEKSAKTATAVDLNNIFSGLPIPARIGEDNRKTISQEAANLRSSFIENGDNGIDVSTNGNGNHSPVKAAIRQTAILERIRQNGNCRLRDIEDVLQEASERTIRYDLQNLVEKGLIERMGNGGPATFYKVKA